MTTKRPVKKWKLYGTLIGAITAVTLLFSAFTTYVTYPTAEHRKVGQELAKFDAKLFSLDENYAEVTKSKEYKDLQTTQENVYTSRMGIGSSVLSAMISVAIVVALYRYLRRNNITPKPVSTTVLIDAAAMAIIMLPTIYIGELITGIKTEPLMMVMLLIATPFAVGFNALITFVIAKITEHFYNRSHGALEE